MIPTKICKAIINPKLNPTPYNLNKSPDNKRQHKFLNKIKNTKKRNAWYLTFYVIINI